MFEKSHAGEAGHDTPVVPQQAPLDPFGGFQRDDYRYKAMVSQHEKEVVIVKTNAWTRTILAVVAAVVLIYAMAQGVSPPWELALSVLLGKSPGH